uniref:Uncharacterized protein n=1 Tax=Zosterops lateralis melanops TaxID=1220523 RepID=A0A8D2PPY4_ZOSLA
MASAKPFLLLQETPRGAVAGKKRHRGWGGGGGDGTRGMEKRGQEASWDGRHWMRRRGSTRRNEKLHRLCLTETDLRRVPYESMPASVTTLELSLCDIPDAWFRVSPSVPPPQVRHLAIHSVPTFSDHHLVDVSSQNHLKTLSLCGTYRITDMGIRAAAPHLEELERLVLRHCIIGDAAMVFIGRHMRQLRHLEISNAYFLTNRGLVAIVTLEHLETLCLDLYDLVSLGTVIALLQVLPRLNHLKLGGTCFEDELLDKIQENFPHCTISHTPACYVNNKTC